MAPTLSSTSVAVKPESEILMSELMGSAIVTISVGPEQKIFTVHRDLLVASSGDLASYFTLQPDQHRAYPLPTISSEVFAIFVEVLYARRVPGVIPGSSEATQASRIRHLCQLYAFGEKHTFKLDVLNKVMDAIQDGFRTFDRFPDYGLIQNIYRNTASGSQLRKFSARCIAFNFKDGGSRFVDNGNLQILMKAESNFLDDFLYSLRIPAGDLHKDPRIRNNVCEQAQKGVRGAELVRGGGLGWWPCWFHVHDPEWAPYVANDETGDFDETPFAQECHLAN